MGWLSEHTGRVAGRRNVLPVFTVFFAVVTLLTAPLIWALLLTVPVLAALVANLYVGPRRSLGSRLLATTLGPVLVVAVAVFIGRADEVPLEGVVSATVAVGAGACLRWLRRRPTGPPEWLTEREAILWESRFGSGEDAGI